MFNIFLFHEYIFSINFFGYLSSEPLTYGIHVDIENYSNNCFLSMDDFLKFLPPCKYVQMGHWVYYPQGDKFLTHKRKNILSIGGNGHINIEKFNIFLWFFHLLKYSHNNQVLFKIIIIVFLLLGIAKELWIYGL